MNFWMGEIVLGISNICIPILLSYVTRNYFENPKKCKRIKLFADYGALIFAILIYTWLEADFGQSGIIISFSRIILILIFLVILSIDLFLLLKDTRLIENPSVKREEKYRKVLIKRYDKYKVKCERENKDIIDCDEFVKKNNGINIIYIIYFSVCGIIFFTLNIYLLIMIFKNGDIDPVGIFMLLLTNFFWMVLFEVSRVLR